MNRFVSIFLTVIILVGCLPFATYADTIDEVEVDRIVYEDGSYLVVTMDSQRTRNYTKSENKYYTYYDSNNVALWQIVLTGIFTYNYSSATCDHAQVSVSVYDSDWYVVNRSSYTSENKAIANVTMGHRYLGVTVTTSSHRVTLTCAPDGTMS